MALSFSQRFAGVGPAPEALLFERSGGEALVGKPFAGGDRDLPRDVCAM